MKGLAVAGAVIVASASGALAPGPRGGRKFVQEMPALPFGRRGRQEQGRPPANGLEGRKSGTIEGYTYTEANKNPASPGARKCSAITSRIRAPKSPAPRWCSPASRTKTSSSSLWAYLKQFDAKGEKNDALTAGQRRRGAAAATMCARAGRVAGSQSGAGHDQGPCRSPAAAGPAGCRRPLRDLDAEAFGAHVSAWRSATSR